MSFSGVQGHQEIKLQYFQQKEPLGLKYYNKKEGNIFSFGRQRAKHKDQANFDSIHVLTFIHTFFQKNCKNLFVYCREISMEASPLAVIDRLSTRCAFRGFTGSPCGIIGTLIFLMATIWMNTWIVLSYAEGSYFQSSFETQVSGYQTMNSPYDLKMAIVFYNKTSGDVANHTLLRSFFDTKMYSSSSLGSNVNVEEASLCNSSSGDYTGYFADAVNPLTLRDCFIFTPHKNFLYSYVPNASPALSQVGFYFGLSCLNAFFCRSGGSALVSVQNNLVATFTNFSMTFIFSTRVLQPDGTSRHQVYNVSSGEFANNIAVTATFDAEVMISNITMDYSIMPWSDMKYVSNLAFYGLQRGTPKASTSIYTPLPRISTIASNYQNLIFRYYKKQDWLLGVIGGSAFLIYLCLWLLCHCINQSSFRINAAQELLLEIKNDQQETPTPTTLDVFQRPSIGYTYYVQRFNPFYTNRAIEAFEAVMDITNIIKQLKIAQRNTIHFVGIDNLYDKYRRLKFDDLPVAPRLPLMNDTIIKQQQREQNPQGEGQANQSLGQLLPPAYQDHPQNVNQIVEDPPRLLLNESLPQLGHKKSSQFELNNQLEENQPQIKPQRAGEDEDDLFQVVKLTLPQKKSQKEEQAENVNEFNEEMFNKLIKLQDQEVVKYASQKAEEKMSSKNQKRSQFQNNPQQQVQDIPPSEAIIINQQLIKPEPNHQQANKKEAELLGIHPDALAAIKHSQNTEKMMGTSLPIMQLTNNTHRCMLINQNQEYDPEDGALKQEPKSKMKKLLANVLYFIKLFDFFSVKIQFNADSANHSWFGVLITAVIIALPCLQLASRLQMAGKYQVYVSKDFQQARDIGYTIKTGQGFRPAVCTSYFANSYLTGYGQTVQLTFYTYTAAQGYTYYSATNLPSNAYGQLGITPDSASYNLDTSLCFVMPDNVKIRMGGFNTSSQAYFGFRISGYCSGTNEYCNSVAATTDSAFLSFLNTQLNSFTLYTQLNQYSPSQNTVFSGQVYAHNLREGSSNFNATSAIEETLYFDQIQLIDNYAIRFTGDSPVLESTISTSRYQLGEVTKAVATPRPFYELRIRPSGISTKVYLVGTTLDVLIGMIGGVFFIAYLVFHNCAKLYNNYNVRNRLASIIYEEDIQNYSTLLKLGYLFARPLLKLCCCWLNFSYKVGRMERVDEKMKRDLDAISVVKTVSACASMSLIPFQKLEEKELASVYFKERADPPPKKEKSAQENQSDFYDEVIEDEEEQAKESGHKIVNADRQQQKLSSNRDTKSKFGDDLSEIDVEGLLEEEEGVDLVSPQQPYKDDSSLQRSRMREILSVFDIFHSDAEFSLRGQWRVRSVFGFLLSLLSLYIIFSIFLYYVINFSRGFDRRISYNREMPLDPSGLPPMRLNTSRNFRAAFGFYRKPDFSFQNISNIYDNSLVGISVYQYTQSWINRTMVITENRFDLIPCPSDYFDPFMSPNEDPSYYSSLPNGYCIPLNLTLNLSAELHNGSQYFRVSVFNRTAAGSTLLQSITSSFVLGIYMTVPVINLENNSFAYQVQQLRPNSEVLTRAYNVNVTLTRQAITFTTPNYTYGQNSTTVQNYNYLENRFYEITNTNSPTTAARVYNVTFAHSGLMESYVVTYSSITELFGYAGGIILVVLFVVGCIAQSFNTYYKEYLIGRELYLLWPKKGERGEKGEVREQRVPLMNKNQMQHLSKTNYFNQFDVFKAWLLSFFAKMIRSYDWNTNLSKIHKIRSKALEDTDLFLFYNKLAKIRDTLNSNQQLRLSANPAIPLSSICPKKVVKEVSRFDYDSVRPLYKNVMAHQLCSRDQWRLFRAEQSRVQLESVFDRKYLGNVLIYRPTPFKFDQRRSFNSIEEMVRVKDQVSSAKSKRRPAAQQQEERHNQFLPLESQQPIKQVDKSVSSKKQNKSTKKEAGFDYDIPDQSASQSNN